MTAATPTYRALMMAFEARREQLGWPMWQVDDKAGLQDGYYAKMIYPDAPSGRQSRWETVDLVMEALFGRGARIVVEGEMAVMRTAIRIDDQKNEKARQIRHWRHTKHFKDLSVLAAAARAKKLPAWKRRSLARKAARARWRAERERRRTAVKVSHDPAKP